MRSTTRMRLEDCAAVATGRIRFYVTTKDKRRVSVLGELVDVAPHITCAKFALHPAIDGIGGWRVADIETGAAAGPRHPEREGALSLATANLAARTDDDMRRAQRRIREMLASAEG